MTEPLKTRRGGTKGITWRGRSASRVHAGRVQGVRALVLSCSCTPSVHEPSFVPPRQFDHLNHLNRLHGDVCAPCRPSSAPSESRPSEPSQILVAHPCRVHLLDEHIRPCVPGVLPLTSPSCSRRTWSMESLPPVPATRRNCLRRICRRSGTDPDQLLSGRSSRSRRLVRPIRAPASWYTRRVPSFTPELARREFRRSS